MRCEELLAALGDYVDGDMDPALCEAFREHLKDCSMCELVVDNIRNTISLYNAGVPVEMPPELEGHLNAVLRERWRARFSV
jgi:hypothetical protein